MKYIPLKDRMIVKTIKNSYEKTESGFIMNQDDLKTESKNNLIRAVIVKVGKDCTFFEPGNEGLVVLIHEVTGVPMHGVDSEYKVLREDDIWCYSEEQPDEVIDAVAVFKDSEFAKVIDKATNK